MNTIGKSLSVKGELRASEDLTVEGRMEGPISCENASVVVASSAQVTGNIIARDITVFGHIAGQLVATEVVDIRPDATVTGQIIAKRFILDEDALFNGRAAPQQLEAALRVAKYQQRQRDSEAD